MNVFSSSLLSFSDTVHISVFSWRSFINRGRVLIPTRNKLHFAKFRSVMCEVVTPFLGPGYPYFTFGNFSINTLSGLVYIAIWRGLRSQAGSFFHDLFWFFMIQKCRFNRDEAHHQIPVHSCRNRPQRMVSNPGDNYCAANSGFKTWLNNEEMSFANSLFAATQFFAWTYFATIFIHVALSVKFFIYYSTRYDILD